MKILTLTALLALQAPSQAQVDAILNKAKADVVAVLDKAKADIDALYAANSAAIVVTGNMQAAVNAAPPGATLLFAYAEPALITLTKPVTLKGSGMAALRGGLTITGAGVTVDGVAISAPRTRSDVVLLVGDRTRLLNVTVTGDPGGQKRGIAANAPGFYFSRVTVTGFWLPDQDSQAFACWDNCQNGVILDSYFSGAGETFLIGGADPASQARNPANIAVERTTLTKDPAWCKPGFQVKNTLELKNVTGFSFKDGVIENSCAGAQDGYLIVLTPRNQDGHAPWSAVKDVLIQHNTGGHAAALLNVSGTDDEQTSGVTSNVRIVDNVFTDIDPSRWHAYADWGSDKMVQVGSGPSGLVFSGNTITGAHIGSVVYFYGAPKAAGPVIMDNHWPVSAYGVFGADVAPGPDAWNVYTIGGTLSGNIEVK